MDKFCRNELIRKLITMLTTFTSYKLVPFYFINIVIPTEPCLPFNQGNARYYFW